MAGVCDKYFKEQLGVLSVYGIIELIQIIVSIKSIHQILQMHQKRHFSRMLLYSQWLFYSSAILFALSRITSTVFLCWLIDYHYIPYGLIGVFYTLHWGAILIILLARLKLVFDRTAYKLGTKTTYFFWVIFVFIFLVGVVINGYMVLGVSHPVVTLMIGLLLFIVLMVANFLAFTFVYNLQQLRSDTADLTYKRRRDLFKTVRKYAVLSVISVLFSTFYAVTLLMVVVTGIEWNYWLVVSLAAIMALDVWTDTICMTLSLNVNDKYYKRLCFITAINHYFCYNDISDEVTIVIEPTEMQSSSNMPRDDRNISISPDSSQATSVANNDRHRTVTLADVVADVNRNASPPLHLPVFPRGHTSSQDVSFARSAANSAVSVSTGSMALYAI
eukprot:543375_1